MRTIDWYHSAAAIGIGVGSAALLLACSDPTVTPLAPVDRVRIVGDTTFTLEPLESRTLFAECFDQSGRILAPSRCPVTWAADAPSIASVANSQVVAVSEGSTVLTARVGDRVARVALDVRWRADARLEIAGVRDLGDGETVRLETLVRGKSIVVTAAPPQWSSSDPVVARIAAGGLLTAVAPGTATISVRWSGLSASAVVNITRVAPAGFGYLYLTDAYDLDNYVGRVTPPATRAFTKGGTVDVSFVGNTTGFGGQFPSVNFGWMRGGSLAPVSAKPIAGLSLHAFALDTVFGTWPCMAERYGRTFACYTRDDVFGAVEAVALTGAAFSGTTVSIAIAQPNAPTEDARVQVRAGASSAERHILVDGLTRRDLYWFLTPADQVVRRGGVWEPVTCVIIPLESTPANVAASVGCVSTDSTATEVNATAFASDAHRDGLPAVFAEVSSTGRVLRSGGQQLAVSSAQVGERTTRISVQGAALASFTRWPALLVTPVTTDELARCGLVIPPATSAARLDVIIRCSRPNVGFMFGAVF